MLNYFCNNLNKCDKIGYAIIDLQKSENIRVMRKYVWECKMLLLINFFFSLSSFIF